MMHPVAVELLEERQDAQQIAIRRKAIEMGIIYPQWDFIVSPVIFRKNPLTSLIKKLSILERLIIDLPQRIFNGDNESFFQYLGIPLTLKSFLLNYQKPKSNNFPIRWDLMLTESGWKLLELNTGYALGGINSCRIEEVYRFLTNSNHLYFPNAFSSILNSLELPVTNCMIIADVPGQYEKYLFFTRSLVEGFQKEYSGEVVYASLIETIADRQQLILNGKKIDKVMPLFTLAELFSMEKNHTDYIKLFQQQSDLSLLDFTEYIYSNKGIWALLCDSQWWKYFHPQEINAIVDLVPHTEFVCSNKKYDQEKWLLKPTDDYGGKGIVCGWNVSREEWKKSLAVAQANHFIIQKKVSSIVLPMTVVTRDEKVIQGNARSVLGLITLQGNPIGGLSRCFLNVDEPGVVNAHQGAAVGIAAFEK